MAPVESLTDWLRLTLTPGIGGRTQRRLLLHFGSPEAIFSAGESSLAAVVGDKAAKRLFESDRHQAVAAALAWAEGADQHLITLADPAYPRAFLEIADPPSLLYVRGRRELLNGPGVAIVGSRNPTPQGLKNSERFAAALSEAGLLIVSGLALGIDAAAHRGALSVGGHTLAVIGTGIDRVYPAGNRQLALDIAARGAVISEFPLGTSPVAGNFPRRNRLIAGLTRGTLVVEATIDSGSLITARFAAEFGREVLAIPGSIHSPQVRGCHKLIKQGAKLVETVQDVLEEITAHSSGSLAPTADVPANAGELLRAMGYDPCGVDELAVRCGLTADVLSVMLLHLELDGLIVSLPGGRYQRVSEA